MVLDLTMKATGRKRTRLSPSTLSTESDISEESTSLSDDEEDETTEASSVETSDSEPSSSEEEEDEKPLRKGRSSMAPLARERKDSRSSLPVKPPRKKLKTMNLNGVALTSPIGKLRRKKFTETSAIDKAKKRHQDAAAKKVPEQITRGAKAENLNPSKLKIPTDTGSAKSSLKENGNNKPASTSSKSSTIDMLPAQKEQKPRSRPKNLHGKSEGRRKTDPNVIYHLFEKPSRIYQCLAARQYERPFILKRTLAYMTPKGRVTKQVPKNMRFKLPLKLVQNELVLKDQPPNLLSSPSSKIKHLLNGSVDSNIRSPIRSSIGSPSQRKLVDPKSCNLNLVLCQIGGVIPNFRLGTRKSVAGFSGKKESTTTFLLDVGVHRTYLSKNLELKSQDDSVQSDLRIDYSPTVSDDQFFETVSTRMFDTCPNAPKTIAIDGNLLFPPNGYTQGKAVVRIRATVEGTNWCYELRMDVSKDRERSLENGLYSIDFKSMNGLDGACPHLLVAACWSANHDVLTSSEVFDSIRREVARFNKSPRKAPRPTPSSPNHQQPPTTALSSPSHNPGSPYRPITSRSRITRVVYWLSDSTAGGSGICASVADPFRCPWCHTTTPHFLSLLRHLRCWHPRFSFVLQAERVARVADITVTINKRYNMAEEYRHPPTLLADVPFFGIRQPVRRLENTQLIWFSGKQHKRRNFNKASSTALAEFRKPENELNPASMIMIHGHLRTYYHSQTCIPLTPEEFRQDEDSDTEDHPWITEQAWRLLNEFTDVNAGEKAMMNLWNTFMYRENFFSQRGMFPACLSFIDEFGLEIIDKGLLGNLRLHLTCLSQSNLLSASQVYAVMARLQRRIDQRKCLEASIVQPSPSKASTKISSSTTTIVSSPSSSSYAEQHGRVLRKSLSST